jgi:hypothetical protein
MKRIVLGLFLSTLTLQAQQSQDTIPKASVEKSLRGVQLGLVSANFQYEFKLERKLTLRTEIGAELIYNTRTYYDPTIREVSSQLTVPYITLEPRWYYGIDRRIRKGKNIKNNSSNYVGLKTSFLSARTPITSNDKYEVASAINVIPNFAIRRSFAKHFNYEFAFGIEYKRLVLFPKEYSSCVNCNNGFTNIFLQARIGYNF